ncbi:MAG: UDP-N-acetylmuramoyl-L-alanine--D-glutamate ligase [Gammaproteobacteria bacterium]
MAKTTTPPLQVIVGLGKTGLSCVHFLAQHQFPMAVTDSRGEPPGLSELQQAFPNIPVSLGRFDAELCLQAGRLIVSPGVSLQEPVLQAAHARGIPTIGDIELFAQTAQSPVIAITGSNGKSTVTTLVGEMAKDAGIRVEVGGNLGTPVLDLLASPHTQLFVLELSSFQLETTHSLKPAAAVLLNLSEDHMDRYPTMQAYLAAKQRIYQHCANPIVNRDEPNTYQDLQLTDAVSFGLDEPAPGHFGIRWIQGENYFAYGTENLLATNAIKLKGKHQQANVLAALALGHAVGMPFSSLLETVKNFEGLAHRCQWVATYQGVSWYNDSKATNVGAAKAAIEGLGADINGKLIVIAGGMGKNADFTPLRSALTRYVRQLILIGQDAPLMEAAFEGCVAMIRADSLQQAVEQAHHTAQTGDAVLLAPACASFDMFKNFEDRGEVFMNLVRALA